MNNPDSNPAAATVLVDVPNAQAPAAGLTTGGRPRPEHLRQAQAAGVKTVINLCPHSEPCDYDEPGLVASLGMRYVNIPVAGAVDLTADNARRLDAALSQAAGAPALVHCASGNRVGALFAVRAKLLHGAGIEEALAAGRAAGLKAMEPAVRGILSS
ncbi:MAG: hypothetical protein ISP90_16420 [Nevskia sp.]|nr:hypothetical protein [Nevskia sp.]